MVPEPTTIKKTTFAAASWLDLRCLSWLLSQHKRSVVQYSYPSGHISRSAFRSSVARRAAEPTQLLVPHNPEKSYYCNWCF
jgi:hypothetical protein